MHDAATQRPRARRRRGAGPARRDLLRPRGGDDRDADGHRALRPRGQRLQGHRRADPGRQRRHGSPPSSPRATRCGSRWSTTREYKSRPTPRRSIVTPTLIADRFVQLTPAYTGGAVMADGADIALPDTGTPVELDRIYQSLSRPDSEALGPNGVNKDGTLDHAARRPAPRRCDGQGPARQPDARSTSRGRADLRRGQRRRCSTRCTQLGEVHRRAGRQRPAVRAFMADLAGVSSASWPASGSSSRARPRRAGPARSARSSSFVHDNRGRWSPDVREADPGHEDDQRRARTASTHALRVGAARPRQPRHRLRQPDRLDRLPDRRPAATVGDLDGLLCAIVMQSGMPRASKDLACKIFKQLLEPVEDQAGTQPASVPTRRSHSRRRDAELGGAARAVRRPGPRALARRAAGRRRMSRPAARRAPAVVAWSVVAAARVRLQVRRRLRPAAARAAGRRGRRLSRSPPSSPTSSTSCPASPVMVDDVTVGRGHRRRAGRLARQGHACGCARTSSCPRTSIADIRQTSLLGEKYVALEPPAGRRADRAARRRRQHPALRAPAGTRRSRRSSARCRSCSAAAASASSGRSATS